jgi:hypothetical protein
MAARPRGGALLRAFTVLVCAGLALLTAGCGDRAAAGAGTPPRLSRDVATWTCADMRRPAAKGTRDVKATFRYYCRFYASEQARFHMSADGFTMTYCHLDVSAEDTPSGVVIEKLACDAFVHTLQREQT